MTQQTNDKIQAGINRFVTPILLLIVGYLINDKLMRIEDRLTGIETWSQASGGNIIELKESRKALEHRLEAIERKVSYYPAKKEEEIGIASITK
jgi:hypothetical protein